MPNQLRQTNNEYGQFCGYASERARAFFGNLPQPSEAQLEVEGELFGVVQPEDYRTSLYGEFLDGHLGVPHGHYYQRPPRGGRRQSYGSSAVSITIDDRQFRYYAQGGCALMGPINWEFNTGPHGHSCSITYPDGTQLEVADMPRLPAGMIFASDEQIPLGHNQVASLREYARRDRGEVRYQHQTMQYQLTRGALDTVRPSVDIMRLLFREYELPNRFPSEHTTFAVLTGI
jgi:hypothetical protein